MSIRTFPTAMYNIAQFTIISCISISNHDVIIYSATKYWLTTDYHRYPCIKILKNFRFAIKSRINFGFYVIRILF